MESSSPISKENLIEMIKDLKPPPCAIDQNHSNNNCFLICTDKRCKKVKQFEPLCEICEKDNAHN